MIRFAVRPRLLLILPVAAAALTACVVAPLPPRQVVYSQPVPAYSQPAPVYSQAPQEDYVVDVAPPPPYVEVVPALPYAGAVWIGGYWGWGGGRHYWVPGRYEHGRPGYAWRPHAWVQQGGHWHMHGGGWERR